MTRSQTKASYEQRLDRVLDRIHWSPQHECAGDPARRRRPIRPRRSGSDESRPDQCSLLVNCRTSLVGMFRTIHPVLRFEGSRAIVLDVAGPLPEDALVGCIAIALTYHLRRRIMQPERAPFPITTVSVASQWT